MANGAVYFGSGGSGGRSYARSRLRLQLGQGSADLYLRIIPTTTTVHQGDLITYAFPVWNLGPSDAIMKC